MGGPIVTPSPQVWNGLVSQFIKKICNIKSSQWLLVAFCAAFCEYQYYEKRTFEVIYLMLYCGYGYCAWWRIFGIVLNSFRGNCDKRCTSSLHWSTSCIATAGTYTPFMRLKAISPFTVCIILFCFSVISWNI